jgi:uncharacterized membrane protein
VVQVSRIHFGNIICLLSGLLFGPSVGGLSAGLGSMLYDFTDPRFLPEFWITFIMKFAMGFVAGLVNRYLLKNWRPKLRLLAAAACGAGLYVILFLLKTALWQHFVMANPWPAVWVALVPAAVSSFINALLAVIGSVLLAAVLEPALRAAGLFRGQTNQH